MTTYVPITATILESRVILNVNLAAKWCVLEEIGNDIVKHAMLKNIEKLQENTNERSIMKKNLDF